MEEWYKLLTIHCVTSKDTYYSHVGLMYIIASPVTCKRDVNAFLFEIDNYLRIDDKIYKIKGLETHMPNTDIKVGEIIGVLV